LKVSVYFVAMKSVNEETVSMLAASALELSLSMKSMCSSFCIQSAVAVMAASVFFSSADLILVLVLV